MKKAVHILFLYTLLVILWGAWVRISHSGDGCGDTWPLCQNQLIPGMNAADPALGKTWVEYTHRFMSGLYGIYVFVLWALILKYWPKKSSVRTSAHFVLFFTITEALLGAKLVLFGLVSANQSVFRTISMSLHQINSVLLSGSIVVLALAMRDKRFQWRPRSWLVPLLFLLIATSGAWASLASTLFPSENLWDGLMKDFAPDAHHLLRLRILHPLVAIIGGGGFCLWLFLKTLKDDTEKKLHLQTLLLFASAILFGMLTLIMLSPPWMKLFHLAIAHILWAGLLIWSFPRVESSSGRT